MFRGKPGRQHGGEATRRLGGGVEAGRVMWRPGGSEEAGRVIWMLLNCGVGEDS